MAPTSDSFFSFLPLFNGLFLPMGRLVLTMTISLLVAQALETFGWTRYMAKLAAPLVRLAHLTPLSGAAFSLSFASPAAANAMLAEGMTAGTIGRKELVFANIINSTPAFFVHLPTLAATAFTFLGHSAFFYVGLVLAAALLRTIGAVIAAHITLPLPPTTPPPAKHAVPISTARTLLTRFKKRLIKICLFTIPVYCLVFTLQQTGAFSAFETFLAGHTSALFFLHPGAVGIVILFMAADTSAAFAAAAALLHGNTVSPEQIVVALLIGNTLSSPMRAFRHQLPSYAGYFAPATALLLVGVNQSLRAATLALMAAGFYITHVL